MKRQDVNHRLNWYWVVFINGIPRSAIHAKPALLADPCSVTFYLPKRSGRPRRHTLLMVRAGAVVRSTCPVHPRWIGGADDRRGAPCGRSQSQPKRASLFSRIRVSGGSAGKMWRKCGDNITRKASLERSLCCNRGGVGFGQAFRLGRGQCLYARANEARRGGESISIACPDLFSRAQDSRKVTGLLSRPF